MKRFLRSIRQGWGGNSLLAAKNFGVRQEHILTGNGAAELIKALLQRLDGKMGFIRPTFGEYPNRWDAENIVLINSDNPNGNYIPKDAG